MPSRPRRICAEPGCPELVSSGRCPRHTTTRGWGNRPHWRERYGSAWPKTRARILERDGHVCQEEVGQSICGAFGNTVDHITPRFEGGTDDDDNLRTLCGTHQQRKANDEANRARARKRGGGVGRKVHSPTPLRRLFE